MIHPAEKGGYWAGVPALSGCYSQGETIEETIRHIKEAIEAHTTALKEDGQEDIPPDEELVIERVKVAVRWEKRLHFLR